MTKLIRVTSCVGCDYSNHGHDDHCHHPDIKWGTLNINKFVYAKTMHPDCPLDDEVDKEKIKDEYHEKGCEFGKALARYNIRDATKHIKAVVKKYSLYKNDNSDFEEIDAKFYFNVLGECVKAMLADVKDKEAGG